MMHLCCRPKAEPNVPPSDLTCNPLKGIGVNWLNFAIQV